MRWFNPSVNQLNPNHPGEILHEKQQTFVGLSRRTYATNRMQQADLPQRVLVGNKTVTIQRRLGNGAFGVVYKVKDEASYEVYALKDVLSRSEERV